MIAVIIKRAAVLHDGGNPNGRKTQVFNVVQLSHQPFKITSPGNILCVFDIVVCTEVLEHTTNPFGAMHEICRILKKGGLLVVSAPFDFRIHGPLPDCWRFTIHGWNELLKDFKIIKNMEVKNPRRNLMPIHYGFLAEKK
ncbi:MAG: methyltransferase domain-containing protein [Bacteroidetes bacterium]|nr:methyltransferase domain-containing protein [Bacteroidota bacterium]